MYKGIRFLSDVRRKGGIHLRSAIRSVRGLRRMLTIAVAMMNVRLGSHRATCCREPSGFAIGCLQHLFSFATAVALGPIEANATSSPLHLGRESAYRSWLELPAEHADFRKDQGQPLCPRRASTSKQNQNGHNRFFGRHTCGDYSSHLIKNTGQRPNPLRPRASPLD